MKPLGILLVLALMVGCSSGPPPASDAPARTPDGSGSAAATVAVVDTLATEVRRTWSVELRALQPPVPAGDVVVVPVAARGDEIDVVALDRATGEVRWRRPLMVVGSQVGSYLGELVHRSADGETYVVLQTAPTGRRLHAGAALPYVALDPSTGEVVARTRPVMAKFGAPPCDDGLDVCLRISEETFTETRWVLGSWRLRPERDRFPDLASAVAEGSDAYLLGGTVGNYRVGTAMGRIGPGPWRVPWHRLTASRSWFLDDEIDFAVADADLATVRLLKRPRTALRDRYEAGRTVRLDMAERRTVGVDLTTGEVVWRHRGADGECLDLTSREVPVRCAFTGSRLHRKDWDEPRLEGARGVLEGFDPATGETTWRTELRAPAVRTLLLRGTALDAEIDPFAGNDEVVVVRGTDGDRLLSLVDGSTRELDAGEGLLCEQELPFAHRFDAADVSSLGLPERTRHVRRVCDVRGRTSDLPLGAAGVLTGGVDAGEGTWLVATGRAITAYGLT